MTRRSFQSEIILTRQALLGYVARFGVADEEHQRVLAARLWRRVPRGLVASEVLAELEHLIGAWATHHMGVPTTAAQLRYAMLYTKADAMLLLTEEPGPLAPFFAALKAVALPVVPHDTPTVMPVQALDTWSPPAAISSSSPLRT